jgi:hypothetical protein
MEFGRTSSSACQLNQGQLTYRRLSLAQSAHEWADASREMEKACLNVVCGNQSLEFVPFDLNIALHHLLCSLLSMTRKVASALFGWSLYWMEEGRKRIPIARPERFFRRFPTESLALHCAPSEHVALLSGAL